MRNSVRLVAACAALGLGLSAYASDAPTLVTWRELKWIDLAKPAGARQALLWGDPKAGEHGLLVRWKFNTKVPDVVRTQDLHVVVLAGTFTVEIDGGYKELGPGGFVRIPKGVKHTLGCEAAGECRLVMHLARAAGAGK